MIQDIIDWLSLISSPPPSTAMPRSIAAILAAVPLLNISLASNDCRLGRNTRILRTVGAVIFSIWLQWVRVAARVDHSRLEDLDVVLRILTSEAWHHENTKLYIPTIILFLFLPVTGCPSFCLASGSLKIVSVTFKESGLIVLEILDSGWANRVCWDFYDQQ